MLIINFRLFLLSITGTLSIFLTLTCLNSSEATERISEIESKDTSLDFEEVTRGAKLATGMAFLNDDDILLIEKNTGRVICIIRTINELKELSLCF